MNRQSNGQHCRRYSFGSKERLYLLCYVMLTQSAILANLSHIHADVTDLILHLCVELRSAVQCVLKKLLEFGAGSPKAWFCLLFAFFFPLLSNSFLHSLCWKALILCRANAFLEVVDFSKDVQESISKAMSKIPISNPFSTPFVTIF